MAQTSNLGSRQELFRENAILRKNEWIEIKARKVTMTVPRSEQHH
jgi:hypothetical protein